MCTTPRISTPTPTLVTRFTIRDCLLHRGGATTSRTTGIEEETRDLDRKCADKLGNPRAFRTRVGLGDGSLHALHLYGDGPEAGAAVDPEGFYHFSYTGWPNSTEPACLNTSPVNDMFDVRRTLFSSDGSYVKLEMGPNPDKEWILSMPDGRQVRGTRTVANKLYDANGNWVEIDNLCKDLNCTQPYAEIRDPYYAADSNRRIRIEWESPDRGAVPSHDHRADRDRHGDLDGRPWRRSPWMGGTRTYDKTEGDDEMDARGGRQQVGTRTHFVVKKIEYPRTDPATDPVSYEFGYSDSGYNNGEGWGELNKVTAPSGAVTDYRYQNDSHRGRWGADGKSRQIPDRHPRRGART